VAAAYPDAPDSVAADVPATSQKSHQPQESHNSESTHG